VLSGTSICMTMLPRDALTSSTKSAAHPITPATRCRTKLTKLTVLGDEPGKAVSKLLLKAKDSGTAATQLADVVVGA
jgi:hypothetical protein